MPPIQTKTDRILWTIILLGILNALMVVFHGTNLDADTSISAMLWQGVHQYGWTFFRSFRFTTDGWQFSSVPIHFLLYSILGQKPAVIITFGWLFFVGCVIASYRILNLTLDDRRIALIAAIVLIWANPATLLTYQGGLGYPLAHNISILYCLLAILLQLRTIRQPQTTFGLFFSDVLLIASCTSDPWADSAFLLPILLASLLLLVRLRSKATCTLFAHNAVTTVVIASYFVTKGFGIFTYLPAPVGRVDHEALKTNFRYLLEAIAGFFNPNIGTHTPHIFFSPAALSIIFAICMLIATGLLIRNFRKLTPVQTFVSAIALLSTAGSIVAFLMLFRSTAPWSARYLDSLFFFTPIYLLISFKVGSVHLKPVVRVLGYTFIALFTISSLGSSARFWNFGTLSYEPAFSISNFLKRHGLGYGYGDYWGAESNTVSWLSQGKALVRPIQFDSNSGRARVTAVGSVSNLWYLPEDQVDKSRTFIVVTTHANDACRPLDKCVNAVTAQIGKPDETLPFSVSGEDYVALVWNRPILGELDPAR